jgi:hypothetical protein
VTAVTTHHEKPTTLTSPLPAVGQVEAPLEASTTTGSSTSWQLSGCSSVGVPAAVKVACCWPAAG